jgi:RimJ/RimL family protein N-acetyltransferase
MSSETPALRLQSRRVLLRPFTADDITPGYLAWLHDPEVLRYSNQRFAAHTAQTCQRYLASFQGTPNLFFSARLREGDQAIGTLTAYRSPQHGTADIGILIGERSVWGHGLGAEAFGLLADWLAAQPGLRKVTAGTLACNQAMVRTALGNGMHQEAVRRAQELVAGQPVDMLYFARFTTGH